MGQDNQYVYKDSLCLTDENISDLMAEGVITAEG